MTIGAKFEERFGLEQMMAIYSAAEGHENTVHDGRGSDPFRWALAICIGYQCMELDGYREYHGITVPFEELRAWIKAEADLAHHDGDVDYLALFLGEYDKYMPE